MRAFSCVLFGVGVGAAMTALYYKNPVVEYATGYDGVERAADRTFDWGTKARAKGKVKSIAGAVKEGVGRFTGDDDLAMEGSAERALGDVKDAAGVVGQSVGETIHDLNR